MSPDEPSCPIEPVAPPPVTLLIVNDDEDSLFLFEHHLKRAFPSAKIRTARYGHEGLEIFQREPISVIVTDNRMPLVSGITLARKVREVNLSVPVIMVTSALETRDEALDAGVSVFYAEVAFDGVIDHVKRCLMLQ